MNKIRTITLKEIEYVMVDGKYQERVVKEETLPMIINNRAMLFGKERGYFNGTASELINTDLNNLPKTFEYLYMAVEGANKGFADRVSLEEFTDLLNHYSVDEILFLGLKITLAHIPDDIDEFQVVLEEWLREEEIYSKLENEEPELTPKDLRKKK